MRTFFHAVLAALALGASPAWAGDPPSAELDFRYVSFPEGKAGRLVYLDVLGTPVPPIELEDGAGGSYKLNLRIRYDSSTEEIVIRPFLYRVEQTRKGERIVALGDTEVRTTEGAQASVRLATDDKSPPKGYFEMDFRPTVSVRSTYPKRPDMPATTVEAAPAVEATPAAEPDDSDEFIKPDGG
jgi:hypothetical protein